MSTGSISLDILLNKILTDAISGGNESIRAIQKRYPSLSEKEAHEILAMVSATAQSNDDSAELVVTAPPSFALKTKPTKVTVREMLMGARKSILITGYSLSDYFAELVDCVIQKSQEGVLVKFFVNDIESQKAFDRLCCYKGKFLRIYNYPKQEDKMSALHAKVISVDQTDTLITSANLSYHGQEGNIELGARIHSKELAKQVEDEQMTKEEIQASIKSIMFSGSVCGIEIYACLRDESGYQTKKIRATDKLLSSTKDKVAGFINCTYLADDAEFDTSENIADNKKEFYEISLIENYRPFIFLDDAEKRTEYYSESDRNKLSGFLFRINLNDKYFWVYQHIYSVSRIDRSKNVIALFVGDTYDEIDSDIVQIDSRADVIIFSSSVVTAKMDLMQRFFGFEQYIRAGAQKTIEIIRDLDIVDSLEKFVAFENKSKLTNAKKLLKAKNSPVLQMKKNDLLENLKKHSRYKTMFKFEEDHIVISSQKEAAAFIKMLNDDIVRSELTGKEYDSSSKMLLGPVGASH